MKRLMLAAAAAGTLLAGGVAVANAQSALSNGFRADNDTWAADRYVPAYARADAGRDCGFVTVREHRGNEVVVRRIPRC